ncbi:hypothetical protein CR203_22495 [Salipaludibacillus neizhouensis]|uniref:DUF4097 domain-containing protein n=1 Tax=Salipaludibacillus neizhouensis TaxID=885475 RepID=A0A3A9K493_9BACI|nr:DUF4097 family beta strand repeat-containing protein [Salipaludibacillus neizhouensis]RKL65121.1 hypothetical protein CR203_22495 [Salipaludibacillus neizhouensis]
MLGVILLASQILAISFNFLFAYVWPILVVGLLIEGLIYYRNKEPDQKVRFDKFSIILLLVVLLASSGVEKSLEASSGFSFLEWSGVTGTTASIEEEYDLGGSVEIIKINAPNASVKVMGTDEDEISVSGTIQADEDDEDDVKEVYEEVREITRTDNMFEYSIDQKELSWFSFSENMKANLVIEVPKDKRVHIDVTNGGVEVTNIAENINVQTTNGAVTVVNIAKDAKVQSTNGRIILEGIGGAANLHTTNGTIEVESDQVLGNWDLKTTNGNIRIGAAEESDFYFEGKTTNGKVDGDLQMEREKEGELVRVKTQGSAIQGDGTHEINATTTNGTITVFLE